MTAGGHVNVGVLSGDADLLASLRFGSTAYVHSVFRRAVNVVGDDGRLFTLADRARDDAPDALRLDVDGFDGLDLERGDEVTLARDGLLRAQRLCAHLTPARAWRPWLSTYPADTTRLHANVVHVTARCAAEAVADNAPASPLDAASARTLDRYASALVASLARGETRAAQAHATSLLGLGPGFTPSGDDLLLGLLAVLSMPGGPALALRGMRGAMLAHAAERTHPLSAAALRAAAQGRVRESIAALLDAMLGGTPAAVDAALAPVLAIGASSGRDIVDGVLRGFAVQRRLAATRRAVA